jgi:hypothetical protein
MIAMPEWTELADKRGLDPLGMQNSGIGLYQRLLPGISNVTLRMRYYGFYCWLSDTYARHEGSTDPKDWQRWVRRSEALLALVSSAAGGETGVGGIEWADDRLLLNETVIDFAEAANTGDGAKRYLRQSLGVFGGAYYSQMVDMGLFVIGGHGLPKASAQFGVPLAQHFRETIGSDVEDLLIHAIKTAQVSRDELATLRTVAPSQIPGASSERAEYELALLREGDAASERDRSRRESLLLLLIVAKRLGRRPTADEVRWHLFEASGDRWPDALENQRLKWEAYQAQDVLQIAAAGLLDFAISIMNESKEGSSLADLRLEVEQRLRDACDLNGTWQRFRDALIPSDVDYRNWTARVSGRRFTADQRAVDAVRLLAAIDARVAQKPSLADEIARSFASAGLGRSIRSELRWFHDRETGQASELIAEYTISRVVRRHSWVAMQKLRRQRDYTFLFEARDGRYVRRKSYQPVATTPRLAPAIQFLVDIGLLASDGLTDRGHAFVGAIQ